MSRKYILATAACPVPIGCATADPSLNSAVAGDYAYTDGTVPAAGAG